LSLLQLHDPDVWISPTISLRLHTWNSLPTPIPLTLEDHHQFNTPIYEYKGITENPYIEWNEFRTWHNGINHLTLQCYQGILSHLVPASMDITIQLQYIVEYGAVCKLCQDVEDYRVSLHTLLEKMEIHHPLYHLLFY